MSARGLYSELYSRELNAAIAETNGDGNGNGSHQSWHSDEAHQLATAPRRAL
jgi:hypothetical protein